ncbi:MAG: starch-binding protein [Prevotella sp.]|nr:starch-binding protein [Prevotella sp.]
MKRILLILSFAIFHLSACLAQGWPSGYGGVMLQGFYWDSYSDSQWSTLEKQVDNLSTTFDLVWIPQSANCGGQSMGYDDLYWFSNYNSSFGTGDELKSMIQTFKSKGIGTIADIVINHRKNVSNWVDFPKETYKGVTYQLQSTDICANDDDGATKTWATQNGYSLSSNNDTGEGWGGMRDLDHKSTNVQTNVKAYLKMLLEDYGYAGFRYDMVKGYSGEFTKLYNNDAKPQFSVGECWDGSNTIKNWIDATDKTSAAFDFQFRYTVRNAANNGDWTNLGKQNDGNWPLVSSYFNSGSYRQYAVTFVENHDTEYRSASAQQDPLRKDTLAANAYLLAMPGTPCVFMKHWQAYKQEIANMATVRKAVGITNVSVPTNLASKEDYYAVQVAGSGDKKLLCVVGAKAGTYTPTSNAWKKVISGYHYAYYVQGIAPEDIKLPELKDDDKPNDGKFGGVPSFCTVNEGVICAFFEAPVAWGSQIYTWAWMNGGDGKDYVGTAWPGASATLLGTADNGNRVFKWISTKTTAPNNIIFSGGGNQTDDLTFVNGGYYNKDGKQATVTTGIETLRSDSSLQPSAVYDLQGRQVSQPKSGLYIINQKKVIVR